MSQPISPKPDPTSPLSRRLLSHALVFLIAFLIGFVPAWMRGRETTRRLAESERALGLLRQEHALATAAIDARRGDYEPARQAASNFFTSLRAETEKGNDSLLTAAQKSAARPLFDQRDEIITLLARSDPAAADRLLEFYTSYRKMING